MFFTRHAGATLSKLAGMFGAVLVTGARQVGKTTLLSSAAGGADYVTLDDPLQRAAAGERGGTLRATRTGAF